MSELKLCQCGGEPEIIRIGNEYTRSRKITIRCPKCRIERTNAAIRQGFDWLEKISIEQWNYHPIEDKYRKALEDIVKVDSNGFINGTPAVLDKYQQNAIMKNIANEALK
jgi:hypothetical protein